MRPVLYVLTFLAVIALGFWAYRENYATQASLREVRGLQNEIADLRESLSVQRTGSAGAAVPDAPASTPRAKAMAWYSRCPPPIVHTRVSANTSIQAPASRGTEPCVRSTSTSTASSRASRARRVRSA